MERTVEFDFQKELIEYCESDVQLLKQGCLTFKRLFEQEAKFNPWNHITIASACNRDLRQNRMTPNTIASEPIHGWQLKSNHSKVVLEWLHWMDRCLRESLDHQGVKPVGFRIRHAGKQGKYRIPNSRYTVDGYNVQTNTIYEFQVASGTDVPLATPTVENPTDVWKTVPRKRCTDVPKRNFSS